MNDILVSIPHKKTTQSPKIGMARWARPQRELVRASGHERQRASRPARCVTRSSDIGSGIPTPDDHFARTLAMKYEPTPLEQDAPLDEDLQFAAAVVATRRGDLRAIRRRAMGAVKELKQRCQEPALHVVMSQRDIGLLGRMPRMREKWAPMLKLEENTGLH